MDRKKREVACRLEARIGQEGYCMAKNVGRLLLAMWFVAAGCGGKVSANGAETRSTTVYDLFARTNLVAWCIVPFDSKKRGPEERAAMLERLGLRRFAYDYRAEHIPTFEAEIEALRRHGIALTAWWFPTTLNDEARNILEVLKRNNLKI